MSWHQVSGEQQAASERFEERPNWVVIYDGEAEPSDEYELTLISI